jgi:hypothetical protein
MDSACKYLALLVAIFMVDAVIAFGIIQKTTPIPGRLTSRPLLLAAKKDDGRSMGMDDAFRQLDELKALDDDDFTIPDRKKKQDEAFAKAMKELDLKDIAEEKPAPIESEVELYKDLASEMESTTETDLIAGIKTDLGGTPTSFPMFDPTTRDTEKFMEQALDQALQEAEKKAQIEINKESLLDNKEIMKEIEKIFDKANTDLLAGIEEMRMEQVWIRRLPRYCDFNYRSKLTLFCCCRWS